VHVAEVVHVSNTTPLAGTFVPPLPGTGLLPALYEYITEPPVEVGMHAPMTT